MLLTLIVGGALVIAEGQRSADSIAGNRVANSFSKIQSGMAVAQADCGKSSDAGCGP